MVLRYYARRSLPASCCMWLRMAHAPPSYVVTHHLKRQRLFAQKSHKNKQDIAIHMSHRAFGQLRPFDALLCEDLARRLRARAPPAPPGSAPPHRSVLSSSSTLYFLHFLSSPLERHVTRSVSRFTLPGSRSLSSTLHPCSDGRVPSYCAFQGLHAATSEEASRSPAAPPAWATH